MMRETLRFVATRPQRRLPLYWSSLVAKARGQRVVHMLHIGKTGGSAVKTALRRSPEPLPLIIKRHHHDITLADIPPWDDVFFFLRDPVARFVSAFNDRLREGAPRFDIPWSADEHRAFQHFSSADELARALSSDDLTIRREAEHAMRTMRHLSVHYGRWLRSRRRLKSRRRHIVLVGRQERLVEDFERLKEVLGLPESLRLPKGPRRSNRAPADAVTELSERAEENLRRWYAADYELMHFAESLQEDLPGGKVRQPGDPRRAQRLSG